MKEYKGEDIKYVTIEMVKKTLAINEEDKISSGFLKGMKLRTHLFPGKQTTDKYIVIKPIKDDNLETMTVFNLELYNILSFEVYDGSVRDISFFVSKEDDQKLAVEVVEKTIEALIKADRMESVDDSNKLINVNSFSNEALPNLKSNFVAENTHSVNNVISKTAFSRKPPFHQNSRNIPDSKPATTYVSDYEKRQNMKMSFIERKTKRPTQDELTIMKEKIILIHKNNYTQPKFLTIKKESEIESHEKNHNPNTFDNDWDNNFCNGFCG